LFSAINLLGLAIGLVCVILFFLWVKDELSYDRFHRNRERTYNLLTIFSREESNSMSVTPFPLAPLISDRFPEVEAYSRYWNYPSIVSHLETTHLEKKIHLVDPAFLEMFSFRTISGDPVRALSDLSSAVLTRSAAHRYFGDEDPMGRVIMVNRDLELVVAAVLEDPPDNTVLDFSMLFSMEHVPEQRLYHDWTFAGPAYIMLEEGSDWKALEAKIAGTYQEFEHDPGTRVALQPLKEVYLYQDGKANRIIYVYLFSGITVLILLLACINYMNLGTARSLQRVREIGLRKTNGASRWQIIKQFLGESMWVTLIALFLALILVELIRPLFNTLTLKNLEISYGDPVFLAGLIFIFLLTSLISGLYPALVLSRYKPSRILESGPGSQGGRRFLNALVILQFSISIALVISTITINRQVRYIQNRDIGMNRQNVLVMPFSESLGLSLDPIREHLLTFPEVLNVSASYDLPFYLTSAVGLRWEGAEDEEGIGVSYNMIDFDFIETMEIELMEGRAFSRDFPSDDSIAYLINETALNRMGMESATGLTVNFTHPHIPRHLWKGKIIGVVKDFNIRPVSEAIRPLVMRIYRPFYRHLMIRYRPGQEVALLGSLEQLQRTLMPGLPFHYSFLDDEYDLLYETEYRTARIIRYFTLISILISCLGLFGIALYDLELRKKEIAIRKVLASSVSEIITMLLVRYLKWIMLAFVVASPISYLVTRRWLQHFEFGVNISPFTYLLSLLTVLLLALATVGFLSGRSARLNPAGVLQYE
jgi:putative ABC transport system permease protein